MPAEIPDDGIIRVLQFRGRTPLRADAIVSPDCPPIEIAFPTNCNDRTQYFKVEIHGHLIASASINGDVVAHGPLHCSEINGDVRTDGDLSAHEIHAACVTCRDVIDCNRLTVQNLQCAGQIHCNQCKEEPVEKTSIFH